MGGIPVSRRALMYDESVYTPVDGQIFIYDSATEAVIPSTLTTGGTYVNNTSGAGGSPMLIGSFTVPNNTVTVIGGSVLVTAEAGANYTAGDSASWVLPSVIVKYVSDATYDVFPDTYESTGLGGGTATPDNDSSSGNHFSDAAVYIVAVTNTVYVYYLPSTLYSDTTDIMNISCSLLVNTNSYV